MRILEVHSSSWRGAYGSGVLITQKEPPMRADAPPPRGRLALERERGASGFRVATRWDAQRSRPRSSGRRSRATRRVRILHLQPLRVVTAAASSRRASTTRTRATTTTREAAGRRAQRARGVFTATRARRAFVAETGRERHRRARRGLFRPAQCPPAQHRHRRRIAARELPPPFSRKRKRVLQGEVGYSRAARFADHLLGLDLGGFCQCSCDDRRPSSSARPLLLFTACTKPVPWRSPSEFGQGDNPARNLVFLEQLFLRKPCFTGSTREVRAPLNSAAPPGHRAASHVLWSDRAPRNKSTS